jgi:hypothetical protein
MAAIPPMHAWLPAIKQAGRFRALVTIQALSGVPAGGIGVLKVATFVFGPAMDSEAAMRGAGFARLCCCPASA